MRLGLGVVLAVPLSAIVGQFSRPPCGTKIRPRNVSPSSYLCVGCEFLVLICVPPGGVVFCPTVALRGGRFSALMLNRTKAFASWQWFNHVESNLPVGRRIHLTNQRGRDCHMLVPGGCSRQCVRQKKRALYPALNLGAAPHLFDTRCVHLR